MKNWATALFTSCRCDDIQIDVCFGQTPMVMAQLDIVYVGKYIPVSHKGSHSNETFVVSVKIS